MAKFTVDDLGGKTGKDDLTEIDVVLGTPRLERYEKDGLPKGMIIIINGVTKDGKTIERYLYATTEQRIKGKDKGKTEMEIAMAECIELGMSEPFSPSKLGEIEGTEAVFVVGVEVWKDKPRIKVKFINTGRRPTIPQEQADAEWAAMFGGGAIPAATATGDSDSALPSADDDNLPF